MQMNIVRKAKEYEIIRNNKKYYTTKQFYAARLWLEELFKKSEVPVYDCSEPGCGGDWINKLPLKDYFKQFDNKHGRRGRRR